MSKIVKILYEITELGNGQVNRFCTLIEPAPGETLIDVVHRFEDAAQGYPKKAGYSTLRITDTTVMENTLES